MYIRPHVIKRLVDLIYLQNLVFLCIDFRNISVCIFETQFHLLPECFPILGLGNYFSEWASFRQYTCLLGRRFNMKLRIKTVYSQKICVTVNVQQAASAGLLNWRTAVRIRTFQVFDSDRVWFFFWGLSPFNFE